MPEPPIHNAGYHMHGSHRGTTLLPSVTMHLTDLVKLLRAEGRDIIGLVGGEPDYNTAEPIKQAGIKAIVENVTRYPPGDGIASLREAICQRLWAEKGLPARPEQILVSSGTKPLLNAALLACADRGDEVVIPAPYWISYPEMAKLAGLEPRFLTCLPSNHFIPTADQLRSALSPRTRVVILNSPNNPTGAVYNEAQMLALAAVLRERPEIWIVTDEIYDTIHYTDGPVPSFAALGPELAQRTIAINGFSKGYAMAGWRLGYAFGPHPMIATMGAIINHLTGPTSGITQLAGLEALTGDHSYLKRHADEYRERRDIAVEGVRAIPGLTCLVPDGAFFLWIGWSALQGRIAPNGCLLSTDEDFVHAAAEAGVMMMPGSAFGMSPYLRISYSVERSQLREALRRLKQMVITLR